MKKTALQIRRITVSAVFLSIALVMKTAFSFYIPLFGQNGSRIGVSGIFSVMPSILFGPVYGAVVSGLSDFMGYMLRPTGAYMPLMTLIMAAGGFLRGLIWIVLRGRSGKRMRMAVAVFSVLLLALGLCNTAFLHADGVDSGYYTRVDPQAADTDGMHLISRMLVARTADTKDPAANLNTYLVSVTAGLIGSAVFGLLLLLADLLIAKYAKSGIQGGQVMQLLIAMVVSGLVVTTLNTVLLRETVYASWKLLPFSVVWIPRAIEEIVGNTVKAYFVTLLLGVFNRQRALRELVR